METKQALKSPWFWIPVVVAIGLFQLSWNIQSDKNDLTDEVGQWQSQFSAMVKVVDEYKGMSLEKDKLTNVIYLGLPNQNIVIINPDGEIVQKHRERPE